jgi:hypothetical protein
MDGEGGLPNSHHYRHVLTNVTLGLLQDSNWCALPSSPPDIPAIAAETTLVSRFCPQPMRRALRADKKSGYFKARKQL